jgi:DNA-directed RNA polymerase specialized sigma24 family protein
VGISPSFASLVAQLVSKLWVFLMLESPRQVVWSLLTYTDWWQPATTSVLQVGAARRKSQFPEGIPAGLLETLDVRAELCRRVSLLEDRDRQVLYLWYVVQLPAEDIAKAVRISRRQCFRRRARAIRKIVEFGEPEAA